MANAQAPTVTKPARLLVLDDERPVAEAIQIIAEAGGHQARYTSDTAEFFELLRDWAPTHLAIDMVMPGVDGIELLAGLASRQRTEPIIISGTSSGKAVLAARRYARDNGLQIAGVLRRPLQAGALQELLAQAPALAPAQSLTPAAAQATAGPEASPSADLLDLAIKRGALSVAYQPKFGCETGRLVGFEALARWHDPSFGQVSPAQFVPLAERHGLIAALTERVVEVVIPWFARLEHRDDLTIAVNISPRMAGDSAAVERLAELCRRVHVDPDRVILEIAESSVRRDDAQFLGQLARLRLRGFQLAVDDFADGLVTLRSLAKLLFTEIKIDRSVVMAAQTSAEARATVQSVLGFGRHAGLRTTAEGVEDAATMALLRDLGADFAQGYHLGMPLAPEDAARLLTQQR